METEIIQRLDALIAMASPAKDVMNIKEVASYLGTSESYIRKLTSSHILPYSKPDSGEKAKVFYLKKDIDAWLESGRQMSLIDIQYKANEYLTKHRRKK